MKNIFLFYLIKSAKFILVTCFLFFNVSFLRYTYAQKAASIVFASGEGGYQVFRIPAIIRLPNGDLLAFAEGRVNGLSDFGDVDIVMKRSNNNGKTWSALQVVASNDSLQAGNPAPVIDVTDPLYPNGRLFLFYNTGNKPEEDIRKGIGTREIWYITSIDNGKTWSPPMNITNQVKKPDWRSYANTPGHAIQFRSGIYKGRIYVAANHSRGDALPHFADYRAHGFYSDDHGKTFYLSEDVPFPGGNEATAAEISNNGIIMNIRNQYGLPRCRIVAISKDGGRKWDTTYYDQQLPDPICEGSILNLGHYNKRSILAFCNNNDTLYRRNLTLRISFDNGKSWPRKYSVEKENVSTGYSDIVNLGRHMIGVLYERNRYSEIVFKIIKWR